MLVPEQGEAGPLEVGLGDVVGDAAGPCRGLPLLERLHRLVHQPGLREDAGAVEHRSGRQQVAVEGSRLLHEGEGAREVAQQHLEASAVVQRGGRQVGEAERHGILVRASQPDVALVVPTEELVGQAEVEVQEAPGARCDLGRQRHPLEQLTGALPLADPAVQPGTLHHREGADVVGAGPDEQAVGDVEEGEGPVPVAALHS